MWETDVFIPDRVVITLRMFLYSLPKPGNNMETVTPVQQQFWFIWVLHVVWAWLRMKYKHKTGKSKEQENGKEILFKIKNYLRCFRLLKVTKR